MAKSRTGTPKLLGTMRIPAGFRDLIIEHNLSKNEILAFLLILERTLDNVSPPKLEAALSIRYIAQENGCVTKTAENAVKKLKEHNLIRQKVTRNSDKPSMMSLNYDRFPYAEPVQRGPAAGVGDPATVTAAESTTNEDITAIREMLHTHVNARSEREPDLPEPILAAALLDYFGSVPAVEAWVRQLHGDWDRKGFSVRGYGIYDKKLAARRRDDLRKRYLPEESVTEPFSLDAIAVPQSPSAKKRKKVTTDGWKI
jgi:hypothetical protein